MRTNYDCCGCCECHCEVEDDRDFEEEDWEEQQEREMEDMYLDCKCGAYQLVKGKIIHVADCCC